jgi:AcrR family transcriptional regulator
MTNGRKSRSSRLADTQRAILDTARDLFLQFGLRRTSMEDIAAAMGKRKSFLYYYFPGKAEVLRAVAEREFEQMSAAVRVAVEREVKAEDRLRAYMKERAAQLMERIESLRRLHTTFTCSDDLVEFLQVNEFRRAFDAHERNFLKEIIQVGVNTGQFRFLSEVDIDSFSTFALSSLRGSELDLMLDPGDLEHYETRSVVMVDLLLDGFRPCGCISDR